MKATIVAIIAIALGSVIGTVIGTYLLLLVRIGNYYLLEWRFKHAMRKEEFRAYEMDQRRRKRI